MTLTYGSLLTDEAISAYGRLVKPAFTAEWLAQVVPALEKALSDRLERPVAYATGIVEWPTASDDATILLEATPVASISEIRWDPIGGYGQISGTFGDTTVLTAGTDYYLELDGKGSFAGTSVTGSVVRRGRTWGFRRQWQRGLIASSREEVRGTIKVTYSGGYTATTFPEPLRMAMGKALAILRQTLPFVGPVGSEMIGGYNYSKTIGAELDKHEFAEIRQLIGHYKRYRVGGGTVVS